MIVLSTPASSNRPASRRGASLVAVIVAVVFALAAIGFGFVASSDKSKAQEAAATAERKATEAEERFIEEVADRQTQARGVGFFNREDSDPKVDLERVATAINNMRATFTDVPSDVSTLEDLLLPMEQQYRAALDEITNLRSQNESMTAELAAARSARTRDLGDKDDEISSLRQELSDEQANAEDRESDLSDRLSSAEDQASELDQQLRDMRDEVAQTEIAHQREVELLKARILDLSSKTAFLRGNEREKPDGEVLSVSEALGTAYINIGAQQRVVEGLTFRIESGDHPTDRRYKGDCRVISVAGTTAQVEILELADEFDYIGAGDVVINPIFDPSGNRNAVLAGRFVGAYAEDSLKLSLARIGVTVQDSVDATTDMLILGTPVTLDEDGLELDEPMQPSELPVYSEAESLGVSIVPFNSLRKFMKL